MTEGAIPTTGGLQPLSAGETLDRAINIYRQNATTLWTILAVVVIPIQVIELILRRVAVGDVVKIGNSFYKTGGGSSGGAVAYLIIALLSLAAILIANGATVKAIGDAYLGHPADWRESLRYSSGRFWSLLGLAIVLTILLIIGYVLIVIPGIYLTVIWSVAIPAMMMEGLPALGSMQRSNDLVKGRWWATFGRLLVALIIYVVAYLILAAIAGAIASGVSSFTVYLIILAIFGAATSILFVPFVSAVLMVIYIDLRVRKEAFDLEMLAEHLGSPAPVGAAAAPVAPAAPTPGAPPPGPSDVPPASTPPPS